MANTDRTNSYSPLAWEIARRADFTGTDGGGIKATVVIGGPEQRLRLEGFGPDMAMAQINLAKELDRWADQ